MTGNTTANIEEKFGELERQWFTEHRAELSARSDLENAMRNNETRTARAAEERLKDAQEHKQRIIRDIERLEDELLDAD